MQHPHAGMMKKMKEQEVLGVVPKRKAVPRCYSPERPTGSVVPLLAVGSTLVGWIAAATAQSTEAGLWIRPRGTALTEEFICARGNRRSSLHAYVSKKASDFVLRTTSVM